MIKLIFVFLVLWLTVLAGGIIFKQASWQERGKFFKWVGISLLTALGTGAILTALVYLF